MKMILLILTLGSLNVQANYEGSHVNEVWNIVEEKPYSELSEVKVNMKRLKKWGKSKLAQSANRTINNRNDTLDYFEKLVHANGSCLLGTWNIDKENEYSGYFEKGSNGIIISRASVALSHAMKGKKRSFGLAGKIYPTTDLFHSQKLETANFFTMDDLGGTKAPSFFGEEFTNELKVSVSIGSIFLIRVAAFVSKVFKKIDSNPGLRQLWQISNLGLEEGLESSTPMWMKLSTSQSMESLSSAKDFREELIQNLRSNSVLSFDIEVAGKMNQGSEQKKNFKKIGTITYKEVVNSEGCDHRLHFNHPKLRSDLK